MVLAEFQNRGVARRLVTVGPRWGIPSHQVLPCNINTRHTSPSHCGLLHIYIEILLKCMVVPS